MVPRVPCIRKAEPCKFLSVQKCDRRLSFVFHAIQLFKSAVFHVLQVVQSFFFLIIAVKSTLHPEEDSPKSWRGCQLSFQRNKRKSKRTRRKGEKKVKRMKMGTNLLQFESGCIAQHHSSGNVRPTFLWENGNRRHLRQMSGRITDICRHISRYM